MVTILESQFGPGLSTLVSNNVTVVIAPEPRETRPKEGKSRVQQAALALARLSSSGWLDRRPSAGPCGRAGTRGRPRVGLRSVSARGQTGGARGGRQGAAERGLRRRVCVGLGAAAAFRARSAVLC